MVLTEKQLAEFLAILVNGKYKAILFPVSGASAELLYQAEDGRWFNALGHERKLSTK